MENLNKKEISKIRSRLQKGSADKLLMQKPFAEGMYRFGMFIIDYYSRVREELRIDYDSFMIIQVTVSHQLYSLKKEKLLSSGSYEAVEAQFNQAIDVRDELLGVMKDYDSKNKNRLTISSVCLVLGLPKETTRRKINVLCKKKMLKVSKKNGVTLGPGYKKVFERFVPKTAYELSKLLKNWKKSGVLNFILDFKI